MAAAVVAWAAAVAVASYVAAVVAVAVVVVAAVVVVVATAALATAAAGASPLGRGGAKTPSSCGLPSSSCGRGPHVRVCVGRFFWGCSLVRENAKKN